MRDHLLPRLFGFELLMAPYAICHLKLALEIAGADARFVMPDGERLNVFLTNTLEEPHEPTSGQMAFLAHEIAREADSAQAVKRDKPVMVVLGNPPYSGHSANKGSWIRGLLRGKEGARETGSYFKVDGAPLGEERNPKWLNDDYVKFHPLRPMADRTYWRGGTGIRYQSQLPGQPDLSWYATKPDGHLRRYIPARPARQLEEEGAFAPDGSSDENVFDIQPGRVHRSVCKASEWF